MGEGALAGGVAGSTVLSCAAATPPIERPSRVAATIDTGRTDRGAAIMTPATIRPVPLCRPHVISSVVGRTLLPFPRPSSMSPPRMFPDRSCWPPQAVAASSLGASLWVRPSGRVPLWARPPSGRVPLPKRRLLPSGPSPRVGGAQNWMLGRAPCGESMQVRKNAGRATPAIRDAASRTYCRHRRRSKSCSLCKSAVCCDRRHRSSRPARLDRPSVVTVVLSPIDRASGLVRGFADWGVRP